jgi:hypothetical protein
VDQKKTYYNLSKKQFKIISDLVDLEKTVNKMDLFSTGLDENQNLLPKDGTVFYYGHMMP